MQVLVRRVDAIRPHGENLSIVTVGEHEVIANRKEDGSFRWEVGEPVVYVPENAILPEDVLKDRGYWNDAKGKGLLGGSKGNRVKMRVMAEFESRGLLFKVGMPGQDWSDEGRPEGKPFWLWRGDERIDVAEGDDVAAFFSITEYVPQ